MKQEQILYILYDKYTSLSKKIERIKKKGFLGKNVLYLPLGFYRDIIKKRFFKSINNCNISSCEINRNNILVSLTSYPPRINILHLVVKSLLLQTVMPERIILWLSEEEFPNKFNDLPEKLLDLQNDIFKIVFVQGNLKSHKKYYYAFQQYKEYSVITVDDDLCMPFDTIERLINISLKNPKTVCANVVRRIKTEENDFCAYKKWEKQPKNREKASIDLMAVGYGGVLYPPMCFVNFNFDEKQIFELCPNADDLWLKANEVEEKIKVVSSENEFVHPMIIRHTQKHSLQRTNNSSKQMNDIQWKKTCDHFNINIDLFK